jgi:hypothetical protein
LKNVNVVVCVSVGLVGLVGVAAAVKDRRHHHHHHRSVYKKNFFPPPFGVGDGNSLSLSPPRFNLAKLPKITLRNKVLLTSAMPIKDFRKHLASNFFKSWIIR